MTMPGCLRPFSSFIPIFPICSTSTTASFIPDLLLSDPFVASSSTLPSSRATCAARPSSYFLFLLHSRVASASALRPIYKSPLIVRRPSLPPSSPVSSHFIKGSMLANRSNQHIIISTT